MAAKLNLGLVGTGRLGMAYAGYLAGRIAGAALHAVADIRPGIAEAARAQCGAPRAYSNHDDLIADPAVDALVVTTPTRHHQAVVLAALAAGKPIFCEKPLALTLAEAEEIQRAVAARGGFLQLGFMRRFDPGYAAAKRQIEAGAIGRPGVFMATSKDRERPDLEFLRPGNSGGLFLDLGIHDFDLARWFLGEVASVYSVAGVLAYPELNAIGDWDNAVTTLAFRDGGIGTVRLSRNGIYGYGVHTEVAGTEGAVQVGYDRQTPLQILQRNRVSHDTLTGFTARFEPAYLAQLQDFVVRVRGGQSPAITAEDGVAAQRIAEAATTSARTGSVVKI
jgi:scyllo-inositol 2-dehydrogenase (NAD+)